MAQKRCAEILGENEVYDVKAIDKIDGVMGYKVSVKSSTILFKNKKDFTTKGVIFSGGVLGTVKLLLNLKEKSLPLLSDKLGDNIRTNNETLISVSTLDKSKNLRNGVAGGSLLHTDENNHLEMVRCGDGSGFWKLLHLPLTNGKNIGARFVNMTKQAVKFPLSYFKIFFVNSWSKSTTVLLFMKSINSTFKFKNNFLGGMSSSVSSGVKPTAYIPASMALTKKHSEIIGDKPTSFALESIAGIYSTAHVLGGYVMGKNRSQGVIDKNNEVFRYENMFVIDGAMISANPGVNPSLFITAIAERAMAQIPFSEDSI